MIFEIGTTDNGTETDWNFCDSDSGANAAALDDTDFSIYNLSKDGVGTALEASDSEWTLYEAGFAACASTPDTDLAYLELKLATYESVPAGQTYTYALHMNTTGAKAADDDSVQASIIDDSEIAIGSFLAASDLNEDNLPATQNTIIVASASTYEVGDVLCISTTDDGADATCDAGEEQMLVVIDGGTTLTVIRGYNNTVPDTADANDTGDAVNRVPSAFLWLDDGSTSFSATAATALGQGWGAYLVDGLPLTGGPIGF